MINCTSRLSFFLLAVVIFSTLQQLVVVLCEPKVVPCYFIFGDSLVDNGNNLYRETTEKVNYMPYGIDFPEGPTGRFTNGRTIADIIAELLGFEERIPPYVNATNGDFLRGVNYGSGGCGILDETGRQLYGDVISFNEQLSNHESMISHVVKLLGTESRAKQHLSSCIYSVGFGSNDYLANYLPKYYSSISTPYNPQQFASLLVSKYSNQLQKLYDYGARKVAVSQLGKLGCVPIQVSTYGASEGSLCVEMSNNFVQIFNAKLKLVIEDLNYNLSDANFVYVSNVITSYGNITNLNEPCCSLSIDGHCLPGGVICSNRDEHIFWDAFHPTEAVNMIYAKLAHTDMSPLYASADLIDIV
ncbi:hypothetical protein ACJIZ3_013310 [Penstemon smallii]|uniref:Uncharacterized protein n=1 Tax=Penstemon smallii TaxID=265156 RepID=A0ABD3USS2_9LAMI